MQSKNDEVKKLEVQCRCVPTLPTAPSFEETLAIVGAASLAIHDINPFLQRSFLKAETCSGCKGKGFINVANGPDDCEKVECGGCNGTGRVVANN